MAITEKSTPVANSSVHEDLFYTVTSTNLAQPNFKYVFDVYVGGVLVSRLKIFPEPIFSLGVCNIAQIVRSYLSNFYFWGHLETWKAVISDGYFSKQVQVKYGEEYGSPVTTFTNLTLSTTKKFYNYYNDLLFRDLAPGSLASYSDKFLTTAPDGRKVALEDNLYVYFWNFSQITRTLTIKTYNAAGTLLGTQTDSTLTTDDLFSVNVGPVAINNAYAGFIDSSVAYYTVQIGGSTLTFNIDCQPKYLNYRLTFLNKTGGFDTAAFRMKSAHQVTAERKTFGRSNYRVDSGGNIKYNEEVTTYGVLRGNAATYSTVFKHKKTLSSDYLSDAEFAWLQQVVLSPLVYMEFKDDAGNYIHIPVKVTNDTYDIKTRRNDKLNCLSIDVEILQGFNTQFG